MKKVGIIEVRTRLRNIPEGEFNYTRSENFREQAEKAIASKFPSRIIFCIESGVGDPSASMPEDSMYDLLEALADVGTPSQIEKYGRLIMKEYTSKTRDAQETLRYIKQRLGRAKGKITTRIQNNFDDLWQATNSTIGSAKDNFEKNTAPYKNAIANAKTRAKKAGSSLKKAASKNEEALISAYEAIEEAAIGYVTVDRILENYNRVSKRFNIDRIIQENTVVNGVEDTCIELCHLIETYDMPVKARYNTCLETIWYGLHKNGFTFNEQDVVTTVTDFYMSKGGNSFACKSILEASVVFDKGDYMGDIDVITEEEPEEETIQEGRNKVPDKDESKEFIKDANNTAKQFYTSLLKKISEMKRHPVYGLAISSISVKSPKTVSKLIKGSDLKSEDNPYGYDPNKYYVQFDIAILDLNKIDDSKYKGPHNLSTLMVEDLPSIMQDIAKQYGDNCGIAVTEAGMNKWMHTLVLKYDRKMVTSESVYYQYMVEGKLSTKERKNIKDSDYGIPSKRKYPMPDESHVRSAIQMFNHVDSADEAELARNIKKKIKKYGMSVSVGKENRFSKYYNESTGLPMDWETIPISEVGEKMRNVNRDKEFNKIYGKANARAMAKKQRFFVGSTYKKSSDDMTSFGSGSVFNSLASTNPEVFNTAKMAHLLTCKNLVEEYDALLTKTFESEGARIISVFEKANEQAKIDGDGSFFTTPRAIMEAQKDINIVAKAYVEDVIKLIKFMKDGNISEDEATKFINTVYFPEMTDEKMCRAAISARVNKNRAVSAILRSMIKINFNALGLSEDEAKSLIKELESDETSAEAIGKIRKFLDDPKTLQNFSIGDGIYDFSKIGGGHLFLSSDDDIRFSSAPSKNLMNIFTYDAVVTGHGGDQAGVSTTDVKKTYQEAKKAFSSIVKYKNKFSNANADDEMQKRIRAAIDRFLSRSMSYSDLRDEDEVPEEYQDKLMDLSEKASELMHKLSEIRKAKSKETYSEEDIDELRVQYNDIIAKIQETQKAAVEEYYKDDIEQIRKNVKEEFNGTNSVLKSISTIPDNFNDAAKSTKAETIHNMANALYTYISKNTTDYDTREKEMPEEYALYKSLASFADYLYTKDKADGPSDTRWTVQPINTLTKKGITDMAELLRTLRKEGFKNVLLMSCNPGHVKLPKDIEEDPKFKVTYGMNSVYKEEYVPTDDVEKILTVTEARLDRMAAEAGVVINESTTLYDLYTEYEQLIREYNTPYLHEGVGDALKAIASKAVQIIISIWKAIVSVMKSIWKAVKEFFVGKPTEKVANKETSKPIEVTVVEVNGDHAHVTTKKAKTMEDAKNVVANACRGVSKAIDNISRDETKGMENIQKNTDKAKKNTENAKNSEKAESVFLAYDFGIKAIKELTDQNSYQPDFNKILNDYKVSNDSEKEHKLKALVLKLYKLPPEQVIEGTPNLLKYIRGILVISGFAINPILGIVAFIADQIVAMHMKREESAKMREIFKEEIRKTDKKIESTKSSSQKENLQKYRDSLTKAYMKIDEYYESLLDDKELDDKYDAADDDDVKAGGSFGDSELDDFEKMFGGDFDFDDDEFDDMDGFEEAGKFIVVMDTLLEAYEECQEKSFDQHKCRKMIRMSPSIVGDLVDVADQYPSIISKRDLLNAIDDVKSDIQIGAVRINMIERYDLNNAYDELLRSPDRVIKHGNIFTEAKSFATQIEIIRALNDIYSSCVYYSPLTEASFTNSLKLAGEKLKKAMTKASDADKTISRNIDVSLSNLTRSVERAMTNDRRDAIIKGSVIPSASKIIKGAILAGAGYIVLGPAIATIGVLGYLGMSKKLNDKQRKVILDEIEIELKMCQKYIDLAESKNDLKALKKLYGIQKELQKQRGKIKYKIGLKGEHYTEPEKFDPANQ